MYNLVKTRAYKDITQLHRKLSVRKHAVSIEDRAGMCLPQIRRKKAVIVPKLRNSDGVFVLDASGKKNILTNFYSSLWEDKENYMVEFQNGYMQDGIRKYLIYLSFWMAL